MHQVNQLPHGAHNDKARLPRYLNTLWQSGFRSCLYIYPAWKRSRFMFFNFWRADCRNTHCHRSCAYHHLETLQAGQRRVLVKLQSASAWLVDSSVNQKSLCYKRCYLCSKLIKWSKLRLVHRADFCTDKFCCVDFRAHLAAICISCAASNLLALLHTHWGVTVLLKDTSGGWTVSKAETGVCIFKLQESVYPLGLSATPLQRVLPFLQVEKVSSWNRFLFILWPSSLFSVTAADLAHVHHALKHNLS